MNINKAKFVVVPSAALLLALSGCSSSGTGTGTNDSGPASPMAATSMSAMSMAPSSGAASATAPETMSAPAAAAQTIHIQNFAYNGPDTVAPGSTVTVMNMDSAAHTVTADEGSAFDVNVKPGESMTFKAPTTPGTYKYHCTYHANMHGTLVVK